jgi:hypothetical protein
MIDPFIGSGGIVIDVPREVSGRRCLLRNSFLVDSATSLRVFQL